MRQATGTLIGVVALGLYAGAPGQENHGAGPRAARQIGPLFPPFEEVDTDRDGELSRPEVRAIEPPEFSEFDQNQDGTVTREEYVQVIVREQVGRYPAFEDVDTDADARLSRSELAMIEGLGFATLDADQDGYVSRQEYLESISVPPQEETPEPGAGEEPGEALDFERGEEHDGPSE